MSKGKAQAILLDAAVGFVEGDKSGSSWAFLYTASTVKSLKYNIGDRVITPDGRVFRYSKAGVGGVQSEWGACIRDKTIDVAVAPAQVAVTNNLQLGGTLIATGALGSSVITITKSATSGVAGDGVLAEDELRGGYVVIGNGASQHPQMRCIVGNDASAAGAASVNIYLDAPLTSAIVVGTTTIETMLNPYGNLRPGSDGYQTFLGVPAITATVGQYFWLQTWGPCWITSDTHTCDSAGDRTVAFVANGSVVSSNDVTMESGFQLAGIALDASSSGASNAPMVLLQISP